MDYRIDVEGPGVVITGGSKGIGKALADGFRKFGAFVVNADMEPPGTDDSQAVEDGSISYIKTDITNYKDVEMAGGDSPFQRALKLFKAAEMEVYTRAMPYGFRRERTRHCSLDAMVSM